MDLNQPAGAQGARSDGARRKGYPVSCRAPALAVEVPGNLPPRRCGGQSGALGRRRLPGQQRPSAKVHNAWLTASVSIVDTTPAAPTITFGQPPDVTVGTPVPLSASAYPPGLPVLFSSDPLPVCTVLNSTVTTLAGGTCTITAYQDGEPPGRPLT